MTIAVVDWALRAADQLDYMIRLWVIPFPTEANWSIATTPPSSGPYRPRRIS
jgi:hypothetical protein